MRKIADARGEENGQDKKIAAQAPVKIEGYGRGQSAFSKTARYSLTRP